MADLREQLEGVRAKHGVLTPETVIVEARSTKSPLHARFEWDDRLAAAAHRLTQAGELIRSVYVRYEDANGQRKQVRAFMATPQEDSPRASYEPVGEVVLDPFKRQLLMQSFERDWKAFKARYDALAEFSALILHDLKETAA